MINQIVLLKWTDASGDEERARACAALRALPAAIPSLRSLEVIADESGLPDNFDIAVLTVFDDEQGWQAYQEHSAHKRAVQGAVAPILAAKAAVRQEVP